MFAAFFVCSAVAHAESRCPSGAPDSFLKGDTHLHSRASGDASASLDEIASWYAEADYDFIVVTDHNVVTAPTQPYELLVIPGVELTRNPGRCEPAPPEPDGKCRMHVNGLFVDPRHQLDWERVHSDSRLAIYGGQIDAISNIGGLAQLNHPTWHHGTSGELLANLAELGMRFVEIANVAFADWNEGDAEHPSAEQVWDDALTAGATVWGIASDDAHHFDDDGDYDDDEYPPGGGFVMVRAARDADAIRSAMVHGDFYSSTGVVLDRVDAQDGRVSLSVAGDAAGYEIRWIGDGGRELRKDRGRCAAFDLADAPAGVTYVRAVVTDDDGARAWTQPVRR